MRGCTLTGYARGKPGGERRITKQRKYSEDITYFLVFVSKCLLMWRHFDMSSLRLFRRLAFLAVIIWYFSDKHRMHRLEPHLRAGVVCRIFHLTVYSTLVSFSAQILFESSVLLQYFRFRKVDLCVLNRVLKSPSQSPMYLNFSASVITSASYTRDVCIQLPSRGHWLLFLHEQAFLLPFPLLSSLALWFL